MRRSNGINPARTSDDLPLLEAVEKLSRGNETERGAVFTRPEVVEFILDLIDYTPRLALHKKRLLEPSFGHGDFLLPAARRLLQAYRHKSNGRQANFSLLQNALRAVELHRKSHDTTRNELIDLLDENGFTPNQVRAIIDAWLIQGDFLLEDLSGGFDYVVGNPPYIRQELIPDELMAEYRAHYRTIYDRADIYVPFFEKSLSLLVAGGTMGFICSDRWMKNKYGGPLRRYISDRFHLKYYIDMVDTPAFKSEVIAYPAITVIKAEIGGPTRIVRRPEIDSKSLSKLVCELGNKSAKPLNGFEEIENVTNGADPWVLESFDQLAVVRRIESIFPTLEEAGCKVGIGVATGADKVFIGPYDRLEVEESRKLPLIMARDILSGKVECTGSGVINPFNEDGSLVSLNDYPKLKAYLNRHGEVIRKRHVSQKNDKDWYRTIDRIYPALVQKPKLLIPDIKGEANIVYEAGHFYPHHNLYFIISDEWDLKALQAVLKSGIARLFVSTYSTRMRGGYLRFQAQYLRRIRIPLWKNVPEKTRQKLISAANERDFERCNKIVYELYGLSPDEQMAINRGQNHDD